MKIAVVYVFASVQPHIYEPCARRFAAQYVRYPPGQTDHELYVIVNGGDKLTKRQEALFDPLVPVFIYHNNYGRDIGAYQMAARTISCDLLVCLGGPTRPRMAGWLDLMVRAVEENGPGLFGCWGFHAPAVHIRTTVFWITPHLFNAYPIQVGNDQRYHFEHSHESITLWTMKKGFPVLQVTARGVFPVTNWHHVEQSDSLFADQHCDRIGWVDEGGGW